MVKNKLNREIPEPFADQYGVYGGEFANIQPYNEHARHIKPVKPDHSKLVASIHDAIVATGLKDGMTISFHHHFREGDYVMNMVLAEIAKMGIKNLSIAPSSKWRGHQHH